MPTVVIDGVVLSEAQTTELLRAVELVKTFDAAHFDTTEESAIKRRIHMERQNTLIGLLTAK